MRDYLKVFNFRTKQACDIFVDGPGGGFIAENEQLLKAFFRKHPYEEMIISPTDETLDRFYDEGGTLITKLTDDEQEKYIKESYK